MLQYNLKHYLISLPKLQHSIIFHRYMENGLKTQQCSANVKFQLDILSAESSHSISKKKKNLARVRGIIETHRDVLFGIERLKWVCKEIDILTLRLNYIK